MRSVGNNQLDEHGFVGIAAVDGNGRVAVAGAEHQTNGCLIRRTVESRAGIRCWRGGWLRDGLRAGVRRHGWLLKCRLGNGTGFEWVTVELLAAAKRVRLGFCAPCLCWNVQLERDGIELDGREEQVVERRTDFKRSLRKGRAI